MTTLVLLADTHGYHRGLPVPEGDVLVHAGDLTRSGALDELEDAARWLASLPHRHKLVVAGNHDRCLEVPRERARAMLAGVRYLEDQGSARWAARAWGARTCSRASAPCGRA